MARYYHAIPSEENFHTDSSSNIRKTRHEGLKASGSIKK